MCKFSEDSRQKLGNAVIYIANHTEQLSKNEITKTAVFNGGIYGETLSCTFHGVAF